MSALRRRWRHSEHASSLSDSTGFGSCCGRSRSRGGVISASPHSNYGARRRAPWCRPSVSLWRTSGGTYPSSTRGSCHGSQSRCSNAAANIHAAYAGHTAAFRGDRSITRSRRTPYRGCPTGFWSACASCRPASAPPCCSIGVRYLPLYWLLFHGSSCHTRPRSRRSRPSPTGCIASSLSFSRSYSSRSTRARVSCSSRAARRPSLGGIPITTDPHCYSRSSSRRPCHCGSPSHP